MKSLGGNAARDLSTSRASRIATYCILVFLALFTVFPIFWALSTSLKPDVEVTTFPPILLPSKINPENYKKVIFTSNFPTYIKNSLTVTFICVLTSTVLASHCAYAIARFHIKHRKALMFGILMTSMIPTVALLIPLYIIAVNVKLYNTRVLLVIIYSAWRTPVLTWMLRGYFETIPRELEEAAYIDGCGKTRTFYKIILPICTPALASSALLTAVYVWNDFLVSFTFVTKEELKMLSVGLYGYITQYGIQWGELMAAVSLSIIPIIILFVCLQKKFVAGMSAGAVKG